jgi:orotate phosphoribosyltransferase
MDLKQRFVQLLAESGALLTGDFELKGGRRSNHFVDFGAVPDGHHLEQMGACYAEKIAEAVKLDGFDVIFGPAYKAIPIVTATAIALRHDFSVSKRYAFNRKVEKTYGDGRMLLGSHISSLDRVVIVDDVFTDGGAKLETLDLLEHHGNPIVTHVIVGVDRAEPGAHERFAEKTNGLPVLAICTIDEVQAAVAESPELRNATLR